MAGPNPSFSVTFRTKFRTDDLSRAEEDLAENAAIAKLIDEIKAGDDQSSHGVKRQDVNGDGRGDILLERSSDQYDVYLSDTSSGYFQRPPTISFRAPVDAWVDIGDFNGDGISDFQAIERRVTRVTVYLSQTK